MKTKKRPTMEQYTAYQAAYDYFNRVLFGKALKPCLLNLNGQVRCRGFFAANRWGSASGDTTHEISLHPDSLNRPLPQTMSTLVHEMVHQWQRDFGNPGRGGYHNREWADKMESVGLIPSSTGEPGGKRTGDRVTHYITPAGAFDVAMKAIPADVALPWLTAGRNSTSKPPSKNKMRVRYTCKPCGQLVWGKADLSIVCGKCGEPFVQGA